MNDYYILDQCCKVTLTHKVPKYIGIVSNTSNHHMPYYFYGAIALLILKSSRLSSSIHFQHRYKAGYLLEFSWGLYPGTIKEHFYSISLSICMTARMSQDNYSPLVQNRR